jgi:hypothetical protein
MAITEFNVHGGDVKPHQYQNKNKSFNPMQKPFFYEFIRELKSNKQLIKEFSKDNQIMKKKCISEDLLIRSLREIQKNVLPYLHQMNFTDFKEISHLSSFKTRRQMGG